MQTVAIAPITVEHNGITIELIPAIAEDLKEFSHFVKTPYGHKKKMKLKEGLQFWLKSMFTGKFDDQPYTLTNRRDTKEIAEWLQFKMIYIQANETY
jgi:hypothetical protein